MNSDILIQSSLPRSTNKDAFIKRFASFYGIQPSHLSSLLLAQTRIAKNQDVAFGYQYRLAIAFLSLNYIDIKLKTFGDDEDDEDVKNNSKNAQNSHNSDTNDDEDDELDQESIPIIPTKLDFLLSQLTILDTSPIITNGGVLDGDNDAVLPSMRFSNQKFDKHLTDPDLITLLSSTSLDDMIKFDPSNPLIGNFFNYTGLDSLKVINRNSHVIQNYMKLYTTQSHSALSSQRDHNGDLASIQRFKIVDEDISFIDIIGIITACFSPALFLLALHHICHLILVEPDDFENLAFTYHHDTATYTLFPTKIHLIAYLQVFLAQYTEFIPYVGANGIAKKDNGQFLASQIPLALIDSVYHPNAPDHLRQHGDPSILDQLSRSASDGAVLRQVLKEYYSGPGVLPNPVDVIQNPAWKQDQQKNDHEKNQNSSNSNPKYQKPCNTHRILSSNPHKQLDLYAQIPVIAEAEFIDVLLMYYSEYLFNPSIPSSNLSSFEEPILSEKTRASNTITNLYPSVSSPYQSVPSLRHLGRVEDDLTGLNEVDLWRYLQDIVRQNSYRPTNNKTLTSHNETSLTLYASWQYFQNQDQFGMYVEMYAYLNLMNGFFFQAANTLLDKVDAVLRQNKLENNNLLNLSSILNDVFIKTLLKTLVCDNSTINTKYYLNNSQYETLIKDKMNTDQTLIAATPTSVFPPRLPLTLAINSMKLSLDPSAMFANRYIYPTSLSPLSVQILATNFFQPKVFQIASRSVNGRSPQGFIHKGYIPELVKSSAKVLSLYELCLFSQAVIANGVIPFLLQKLPRTDDNIFRSANRHNIATLNKATYMLLEKSEKPPSIPISNVTPKKNPRTLQGNTPTPDHSKTHKNLNSSALPSSLPESLLSNPSSVSPDHLLNRASSLNGNGEFLFSTLDPEGLRGFLINDPTVRAFTHSLYGAAVEYTISFGFSTVFIRQTLKRLEDSVDLAVVDVGMMRDSLFSEDGFNTNETKSDSNSNATDPSSAFPLTLSKRLSVRNSGVLKRLSSTNPFGLDQSLSNQHTFIASLFHQNAINSYSVAAHITNKIDIESHLPPPSFIIHQITPLLSIDIFPNERGTVVQRLVQLNVAKGDDFASPQLFLRWVGQFEENYKTFLEDRRYYFWSSFLDTNLTVRKQSAEATKQFVALIGPNPVETWNDDLKALTGKEDTVNDNQAVPIDFKVYSDKKKTELRDQIQLLRKQNIIALQQVFKSYQDTCNSLYKWLLEDRYLNTIEVYDDDDDDQQQYNEAFSDQTRYKLSQSNFHHYDISYRILKWLQYCMLDRNHPFSLKSLADASEMNNQHDFSRMSSTSLRSSTNRLSLGPGGLFGSDNQLNEQAPFKYLLQRQKTVDQAAAGSSSPFFGSRRSLRLDKNQTKPTAKQSPQFGFMTPTKGGGMVNGNWSDGENDGLLDNTFNEDNDYFLEDEFDDNDDDDDEDDEELDFPLDAFSNDDAKKNDGKVAPSLENNTSFTKLDLFKLPNLIESAPNSENGDFGNNNDQNNSLMSPLKLGKQASETTPAQPSNKIDGLFVDDGKGNGDLLHLLPQQSEETKEVEIKSDEKKLDNGSPDSSTPTPEPNTPQPLNADAESPTVTPISPKSTEVNRRITLDRFFMPTLENTPAAPNSEDDRLAKRIGDLELLCKRPLRKIQVTLLHDNPLIMYGQDNVEKFSEIQKARYSTRYRQLNSLYTLQVHSPITFSHDDDVAVGNDPGSSDAAVETNTQTQKVDEKTDNNKSNKKKNNKGKKGNQKQTAKAPEPVLTTTVTPTPPVPTAISKWTVDSIDLAHHLELNRIGSLRLEEVLTLDATDTELITSLQDKFNDTILTLYNASPTGILTPDQINSAKESVQIDRTVQLGIIKKYVEFDQRFGDAAPHFYPQ